VGANFSAEYCTCEENPSAITRTFLTVKGDQSSERAKIQPVIMDTGRTLINVKVVPEYPTKPLYIVVKGESEMLHAYKYLGKGLVGPVHDLIPEVTPLDESGEEIAKRLHVWKDNVIFLGAGRKLYIARLSENPDGSSSFRCRELKTSGITKVRDFCVLNDKMYIGQEGSIIRVDLNHISKLETSTSAEESTDQPSPSLPSQHISIKDFTYEGTSLEITATKQDLFLADAKTMHRMGTGGGFGKITGKVEHSQGVDRKISYLTPCYFHKKRMVMCCYTDCHVSLIAVLTNLDFSFIADTKAVPDRSGRMFKVSYIDFLDSYLCIGEHHICHLIKLKLT